MRRAPLLGRVVEQAHEGTLGGFEQAEPGCLARGVLALGAVEPGLGAALLSGPDRRCGESSVSACSLGSDAGRALPGARSRPARRGRGPDARPDQGRHHESAGIRDARRPGARGVPGAQRHRVRARRARSRAGEPHRPRAWPGHGAVARARRPHRRRLRGSGGLERSAVRGRACATATCGDAEHST